MTGFAQMGHVSECKVYTFGMDYCTGQIQG